MWKRQHYRVGLGESSKILAQNKADTIKTQIRQGTYRQEATTAPVRLRELLDVYFERYMNIHRTSQLANERWSCDLIARTEVPAVDGRLVPLGEWSIDTVTADTLERFKEVRLTAGGGKVAINRNLMLLRSCFNWAIHPGGYLTATPFKIGPKTVVRLFDERPRERRLEPGEEARLFAVCKPHLRALIEAALETSCRIGELLSLQWRQVRWEQNEIHLSGGKTKAKKPRYVPISQRLKAVLEMRRCDPAGEKFPPEAYVFGNELGERVKSVDRAWHGFTPRWKNGDLAPQSRIDYARILGGVEADASGDDRPVAQHGLRDGLLGGRGVPEVLRYRCVDVSSVEDRRSPEEQGRGIGDAAAGRDHRRQTARYHGAFSLAQPRLFPDRRRPRPGRGDE